MAKITYTNKITNNGQTVTGLFSSGDANMVKSVVNENADLANKGILNQSLKFNFVQQNVKNPILQASLAGWDTRFREIGNVIKVDGLYILIYSGYTGAYTEISPIYCGIATSEDGETWVKGGVAGDGKAFADVYCEDNYIVYHEGKFYVYSENKSVLPQTICLHTSEDLINWTNEGEVLAGSGNGFDKGDVTSPLVFIEEGIWKMFYEGRSFVGAVVDNGQIGYATSLDGKTWVKNVNPVIPNVPANGFWPNLSIVADDILKIGNTYYLTYHGISTGMAGYRAGIAWSTDLVNWKDYFGYPIVNEGGNGNDIMMLNDDGELNAFFYARDRYSILKGKFSVKPLSELYKAGNFVDPSTSNIYAGVNNNLASIAKAAVIKNPLGGIFKSLDAPVAGALRITLPDNSATFYTIKGTVYDFRAQKSFQFLISCYAVTLSDPATALIIGKGLNYPVKFYTNGTTPNIYIGELNSTWEFPAISIDEVFLVHAGVDVEAQSKNWSVGLADAFVGVLAQEIVNTGV